ncbi:MAG: DegV family EDD domain-containing protein, partial [Candidatus Aminicenantes bacterium]|nr:DegV family EDD domain-containing protein [Candidatus Aminicenantes bacterium]
QRLYYAFLAGGNAVIQDKDYLNRINVFPVPDADTGTNLAATMRSIAETAVASRSLRNTFRSIADAALAGARGNSGLIFAQFVHSLSNEIPAEHRLTARGFAEAARRAVQAVYKAILSPVEGTMLTVMREWADAVHEHASRTADYAELLSYSLQRAREALMNTPKMLSVLARAGVVDAGAKGFVDFIEGVLHFTRAGRLRRVSPPAVAQADAPEIESKIHALEGGIRRRYCAEALLQGKKMDLDRVRSLVQSYGESAIVAGSAEKIRFHVHTDSPAELFFNLNDIGSAVQIKVDDMRKQYEVSHNRKRRIAIVTDSSCDLPPEFIDGEQIQVIPFILSFGETLFLDKVTITPEQFYTLLKTRREHPQTSQAGMAAARNLFSFLSTFYDSTLVFHLSGKLSGALGFSQQAAGMIQGKKIDIIDSRNLSLTLGLLVMRAVEALDGGASHEEVVRMSGEWIAKTRMWADIATLKYLVRGGRISPMKGLVARLLHLKPIITLDEEGKGLPFGKSFSRRANMKKILRLVTGFAGQGKIWKYAIVHAQNPRRARAYAQKLGKALGMPPAFVLDVSPVVGAHNGIGTVAVGIMLD